MGMIGIHWTHKPEAVSQIQVAVMLSQEKMDGFIGHPRRYQGHRTTHSKSIRNANERNDIDMIESPPNSELSTEHLRRSLDRIDWRG